MSTIKSDQELLKEHHFTDKYTIIDRFVCDYLVAENHPGLDVSLASALANIDAAFLDLKELRHLARRCYHLKDRLPGYDSFVQILVEAVRNFSDKDKSFYLFGLVPDYTPVSPNEMQAKTIADWSLKTSYPELFKTS